MGLFGWGGVILHSGAVFFNMPHIHKFPHQKMKIIIVPYSENFTGVCLKGKRNLLGKNSLDRRVVTESWKAGVLSHAVLPPESVHTTQAHGREKRAAYVHLRS